MQSDGVQSVGIPIADHRCPTGAAGAVEELDVGHSGVVAVPQVENRGRRVQ